MRIFGLAIALFMFFSSITLAQTLSSKMDSLSYSVGVIVAQNLKDQGFTALDETMVAAAISDVIQSKDLDMTKEEAEKLFRSQVKLNKEKVHEANKLAGEEFLIENAKKKGITTTESGLQYEVLTMGTGEKPTPSNKVVAHYHGTLIDGAIFDSSVDRGEPLTFPVTGVIQGWQEVLQLMPVGSKFKVYLPYNLAYGERQAGPKIKPYSALIFEIELLAIN